MSLYVSLVVARNCFRLSRIRPSPNSSPAAEAVRARIDWKYLLGLELDDPGFKVWIWQISEAAGHKDPHAVQYFLERGKWEADRVRDRLAQAVSDAFGAPTRFLLSTTPGL